MTILSNLDPLVDPARNHLWPACKPDVVNYALSPFSLSQVIALSRGMPEDISALDIHVLCSLFTNFLSSL